MIDKKEKKDKVLGKSKKSKQPIILGSVIVVLTTALVWVVFGIPGASPSNAASSSSDSITIQGDSITLPLSTFDDGKAHYYRQQVNGKEVDFFVLQSSDGTVRAAFDACDVCYQAKKGYSQQGDNMVCNNCGQRFASNRINEEKGGCNPSPLNREIKDGNLVIKLDDIALGARYF